MLRNTFSPCFATLSPPCFAALFPAHPLPLAALLSLSLCGAARDVHRVLQDASHGLDTGTVSGSTSGSSTSGGSGGSISSGSTELELFEAVSNRASSELGSQTNMGARFIVDVNITSTQQRALFIFTVTNVPRTPAPVFSNSSYHTNAGHLVATFACVPKPITILGIYICTASSLANITVPFKPVNRPKALVDAGFFSNPSGFYSTITVNGVMLRGGITASVANL
ncbi:unnamed protein product [Closterium sp. Naga37s-1]|nr:unnamed protein product [Closterium sp. Naga37s-1]